MAEEHDLALALSLSAKRKVSPGTTQRPASANIERGRRRDMSRLYADLGALLPDLPPRANKVQILEEAIAYVGRLRGKVAELEVHGALAAGRTGCGCGVGGAAKVLASEAASCFAVRLPAERRPGSLTRVLGAFHRHGVPVLAATVTTQGVEGEVTVTTAAAAPSVVEKIKADISSSIAA